MPAGSEFDPMQALILGFFALAVGLFALQWYTGTNTAALSRALRIIGGTVALAAAVVLIVRGFAGYALPLAVFALLTLLNLRGGTGGAARSDGQTSRVTTATLDLELDLDSGAMRGRVLTGPLAGRALDSLTPAELAGLWQDCQFTDPPSAQLLEAYLDRVHASWRDDLSRAGGRRDGARASAAAADAMTRAEALALLGLEEGASADAIRHAHRELMKRVHPDHGGSGYLAAKINAAKSLLLGER